MFDLLSPITQPKIGQDVDATQVIKIVSGNLQLILYVCPSHTQPSHTNIVAKNNNIKITWKISINDIES